MSARLWAGRTGMATVLTAVLLLFSPPVFANETNEQAFAHWLDGVSAEAVAKGIPKATVKRALGSARYLTRVIELDRRQPEFTLTFWRYLSNSVTEKRVAQGRRLLQKHKVLLDRVAKQYGVPARFLVAFWGLESNFGSFTGKFPVVSALSTLGFDGRRGPFFRAQLLAALEVMGSGDIPITAKGSWAGAMGNAQFIPTTYRAYAVDGDGDGKRDMWGSLPDVFASAANYLSQSGWERERTWGREVRLPKGFDYGLASLSQRKTLAAWQKIGVRRADGRDLPQVDIEASLILPAGASGPAFLVYKNYRTILIWNRSLLYAIAVGHLADRLAGQGTLLTPRPAKEIPLSRIDVMRIQELLTAKGFDTGSADGVAGPQTRKAIRAYQKSRRLPADGFPNAGLLERLQGEG